MLVALIDDGIDRFKCPELTISYDLIVQTDGAIREREYNESVRAHHGTVCAKIIHTYYPKAVFCSLQIFSDTRHRSNIQQLIAALNWCAKHRILIIHLSVGSTRLSDFEPLRETISSLLHRGHIIIAAHSNRLNQYTMPACFSGVLGVAADPSLVGDEFYINEEIGSDGIQILASSKHHLMYNLVTADITPLANSYAAPVITAHTCRILEKDTSSSLTPCMLVQKLASKQVSTACERPDFLTEAIVFCTDHFADIDSLFTFKVKGRYSDQGLFLAAIEKDPRIPVVLIPPFPQGGFFLNEVLESSKSRQGVLYAGHAPLDWLRKFHCPTWACNARQLSTYTVDCRPSTLPPVVGFSYSESTSIKMAQVFRETFLSLGVSCIIISDNPLAHLFGMDYFEPSLSLDGLIPYIHSRFQPDVILCVLQNENTCFCYDLVISSYDSRCALSAKEKVCFPTIPTATDIQDFCNNLFENS